MEWAENCYTASWETARQLLCSHLASEPHGAFLNDSQIGLQLSLVVRQCSLTDVTWLLNGLIGTLSSIQDGSTQDGSETESSKSLLT